MENSKLIALLKSFSAAEWRKFRAFISSPYYNTNSELIPFFDYLKAQSPRFLAKNLITQDIYKVLYPHRNYDHKHFKYLMSFLLRLAEQFLGIQKYEGQKTLVQYHILEGCVERSLEKSYNSNYKLALADFNKVTYRDSDYYFWKYLLSDAARQNFDSKRLRKPNAELQNAIDAFDLFYLSKKLKYVCMVLNAQKILSANFQQNLIDEVSAYLKGKDHAEIPAIAVYYQIFLTLTEGDDDAHFEELKVLLQKFFGQFSPSEMRELFVHAINYCLRKTRQQNERFVVEALDLYEQGIEQGVLLEKGILSPWTFENVIKLGLRLKRYNWTEQFIQKHSGSLAKTFRENAVNYGLADLNYHKGNLEESMNYLRLVEFSDFFFTLNAKIMLLKLYFDQDEEDALDSLIASFRIFLKRNKLISEEVKKTYQNFITILNHLTKGNRKSIEDIRSKINSTPLLTDRKWLLEVVDRLE